MNMIDQRLINRIKKIKYIKVVALCGLFTLIGIGDLQAYAAESPSNSQQASTGISVTLTRPILPDVLPGESNTSFVDTSTIISETSTKEWNKTVKQQATFLPKTGSAKSNWTLGGLAIVSSVFLYAGLKRRKKGEQ